LLTPATAAGISTAAAEAAARVLFDPEALAAASAAALEKSRGRVGRLELLVDLRRLYRNLLRADRLLEAPAPAYCPPPEGSSSNAASGIGSGSGDTDGGGGDTDSAAAEVAAAAAVQYVAELQLTEVQLRAALRALSGTYGDRVSDAFASPHLKMAAATTAEKKEAAAASAAAAEASPSTFSSPSSDASETAAATETAAETAAAAAPAPAPAPRSTLSPEAARDALYARVAAVSEALGTRWRSELPLLPFPSPAAAQAALDMRNRRYVGSPLSGSSSSSSSKGEKTGSVLARGAASLASAAAAADGAQPAVVVARLSEAERAVEQFFARRLQPAVAAAARAPPEDWLDGARSSAKYVKGLWDRLNGGGRRNGNGRATTAAAAAEAPAAAASATTAAAAPPAPALPLPPLASTRASRAVSRAALASDVAALEAALRGASAAREARVRAVFSGPARARLLLGPAASELRSLDAAVAALTRAAALRSLQLEAEAAYGALEDEALDVAQGTQNAGFLLFRQGSSEELALLAAEFALLDGALASAAAAAGLADVREDEVAAAVLERLAGWKEERREGGGAGGEGSAPGSSSSPSPSAPLSRAFPATVAAAAAALMALPYDDSGLDSLAREVPDLRRRLGIADDAVFSLVAKAAAGEALLPSSSPAAAGGGHGGAPSSLWPSNSSPAAMLSAAMSPQRIKEVATESGEKVVEGALFFARGLKLLGTDVRSSCGLFTRAAAGASLKPREVAALRRTARDVATFVPFSAILIAPLTPIGHVLVFGFLQRYFPGFFPSQFTSRRQELMMRYEALRRELIAAQEASMQEAEAAELARAAAAVARLTAPRAALSSMEGRDGEGAAAAAAAVAAVKVAAAPAAAAVAAAAATTTRTTTTTEQAASSSPLPPETGNNNNKMEQVVESDESEDDNGPAASALRSLETAVEAAAEEASSAGTDE